MKRISILLIAVLALLVAACTSEQAAPSEEESEAAAATASATPEASSEAPGASEGDGAAETDGAIPSFDLNGDPELAGRFPDSVGGEPLQVQSFRGDTFAQMGGSDPAFEAFLESIDAELADVSVAFGGAASAESEDILSVGAFRVLGANEDDLEREFLAASEAEGDLGGVEEATLAGKDVYTASDPSGETDAQVVIYTKDDTVYFLTGTEAQLTEILEALP